MNRIQHDRAVTTFHGTVLLLALFVGCEFVSLPWQETDPAPPPAPGAAFSLPSEGAEIDGPVLLSVTGEGITQAEFLVDGGMRFGDVEAPFEWTFDPADFEAGVHVLAMRAQLPSGTTSSGDVTVTIPGELPPPEPDPNRFSLPADGSTISTPFLLSVSGTGVVRASFSVDGVVTSDDGTEPFEWSLDPSGYRDGEHEVAATAIMSEGTDETRIVHVTFQNAAPPPPPPGGDYGTIGKWRRLVISLPNATYSGNPFELQVDATFTHGASGTKITLPGYYAGSDTWKIGFMPTLTGTWSFVTTSTDADLHQRTGTLTCTQSGLPGMLEADPTATRKWRFTDGGFAIPIALRCDFFSEPATTADFVKAADFLKAGNLHMLETRLTEEYGQFEGGRTDFIFDGDWRNHRFDLAVWDRMEARMEILAERGLGAHVMFYSDDGGTPGWGGKSATEQLVIQYVVARLAGYPIVWFNTGIDISEYRSSTDINWLGQQLRALDPYGHPVSSRHGGGSGGSVMSGQTFDSWGEPNQAKIGQMTTHFEESSVPVSFDDAWGENRGSHSEKDHTEHDIRRAFWKCVLAGGTGGLIRGGGDGGSQTGFYYIQNIASDLESEQWLRLINPFVTDKLGDTFASMVPDRALVANGGYCIADPARTKLLYFFVGENDKYDFGNEGNPISVVLTDVAKDFTATWFDPRTGKETSLGTLAGSQKHTVTPPSRDDWILLLTAK